MLEEEEGGEGEQDTSLDAWFKYLSHDTLGKGDDLF